MVTCMAIPVGDQNQLEPSMVGITENETSWSNLYHVDFTIILLDAMPHAFAVMQRLDAWVAGHTLPAHHVHEWGRWVQDYHAPGCARSRSPRPHSWKQLSIMRFGHAMDTVCLLHGFDWHRYRYILWTITCFQRCSCTCYIMGLPSLNLSHTWVLDETKLHSTSPLPIALKHFLYYVNVSVMSVGKN